MIEIKYKYGRGVMRINLEELFYPNKKPYKLNKDETSDIVHFTTWGRVKRVLELLKRWDYCNEEAYKTTLEYVKTEIAYWFKCCKTLDENMRGCSYNSNLWKIYHGEYEDAKREFKLFNDTLNMLENTKYTLKDRVKEYINNGKE